ncbi:MAG: NAD(P)/FAD-dependent oxidoreductase [Steroidobacteraceae bacterium]
MDRTEVAVIGGGVVGLAIARALARAGREVLVLEAARVCGSGASSRNSEVIHAGLYYAPGSLKARLCVEGRLRLYELCARRGIPHRRCGKLVVAGSAAQLPALETIAATARSNGVELQALDGPAAASLEPQLACHAALYSPHTGILDSHAYLLALRGEAEDAGAICACSSAVSHLALDGGGVTIAVNGSPPSLQAALIVNAAGLDAPALARAAEGFPQEHIPRSFLAKGSYFALAGRTPFSRLVYPVPEPGGLGIHLTLDLAGRARFGPDVQWLEARDYAVDPHRAERFYPAIRRYWPALPDGSLHPAYAGIRAKIAGPGEPAADFRIDGPDVHGAPIVNLFGIESPGLTASLAIAEHVSALLRSV